MAIKDRGRLDDHYSRLARKEGYPARSVYKLKELDKIWKILKPGQKVLDLGCSPGSWSQYAAEKVKLVAGVDLFPPLVRDGPGLKFFQQDIFSRPQSGIAELSPFQVVLSDLAPKTSGQKAADSARSLDLVRAAFSWAEMLLQQGGAFVFKVFMGSDFDSFFKKSIASVFAKAELRKPQAVRKKSPELYAVCLGFAGGKSGPE